MKSRRFADIKQYQKLHQSSPDFGTSGNMLYPRALAVIRELAPKSILDFGCGKSKLAIALSQALDCSAYLYDPAILGYEEIPTQNPDIVINTDVLEHIEEEEISILLDDIYALSTNVFFNISTRLAIATLPDGRNAHLTVKSPEWWKKKLEEKFNYVYEIYRGGDEVTFITWRPSFKVRIFTRLYTARVFRVIRSLLRKIIRIFE